jgi:hypothetical protein
MSVPLADSLELQRFGNECHEKWQAGGGSNAG